MADARRGLLRWLVFNRAALVVWSLVFCLGAAEAALRIVGWIQDIDYRLYAENLLGPTQLPLGLYCHFRGYTYDSLCPNFAGVSSTSDFTVVYRTNSKGLRDQEYPAEKPAGKTRILAIGDSFTFGNGIAYGDRYTDILESAFDDIEVITMAVPGSGHDQQLMQFAHEGLAYRPDHVFVFVTAATLDPMRYFPPLVREGKVELPAFDRFVAPRRFPTLDDRVAKAAASWPIWRKSHALSFLAFKIFRAALLAKFRQQDEKYWARLIELPPDWGMPGPPPSLPAPQVARAETVFRKLIEIAASNQIDVTFVNLEANYEQSYLGRLDPRIRYLDLSAILRDEAKHRPLGFKYDAHFNPEANALIGRHLIEFVSNGFPAKAGDRS